MNALVLAFPVLAMIAMIALCHVERVLVASTATQADRHPRHLSLPECEADTAGADEAGGGALSSVIAGSNQR